MSVCACAYLFPAIVAVKVGQIPPVFFNLFNHRELQTGWLSLIRLQAADTPG